MLLQCYRSWPGRELAAHTVLLGALCRAGCPAPSSRPVQPPRAPASPGHRQKWDLTPAGKGAAELSRAERNPVTNRGAALLAESPQSKGLALGFAVLKAASLLPPGSSGEVGSIQILLITTHPHQALCYEIQISAVRIILTIPLPNSLSKCTPVPLGHQLLLASWIHKTYHFRTAPSCMNPLKTLKVRIYLEKAPVTQWR